jgi:hypothetical protein
LSATLPGERHRGVIAKQHVAHRTGKFEPGAAGPAGEPASTTATLGWLDEAP